MSDLKTKEIEITLKNKDEGKKFLITEMPLIKADRWAWTALHGMLQGGLKSDIDVNKLDVKTNGGILEFAKLGISALGGMDKDTLFELLDELTDNCVQALTDRGMPRPLVDGDISNIATLNLLRKEALAIHVDFLKGGGYLS